MQISIQWLKRYVDINESVQTLGDLLTQLGFETEPLDDISHLGNVVTAEVQDVSPHPNADKLTVCSVFDGSETLRIVCGAPNVREGLKVFLARIGTEFGPAFIIKKAKLRGVESFGMLCSERELGISDDHSGLMELPADTVAGIAYPDYAADKLAFLELDVTPNRPDALSHIGIAREIALKTGRTLRLPQPVVVDRFREKPQVKVLIDDPVGCPRYIAGVMTGVKVGPSPIWLVELLKAAGQRSINNVVDISNFVLLENGHPTHIFDYRLIPTRTIQVRRAKAGEHFTTLDEVDRKLDAEHLLITDGEKSIALAGIMGGLNTAVRNDTTSVLIESAYFDPVTIRRGSKALGLLTEASRRFERGADPEGAEAAFWRVVELLKEIAGARLTSPVVDAYPGKTTPPTITLRQTCCQSILGLEFSREFIASTLTSLGVAVTDAGEGQWECVPPTFRPDLEREIDLIEEIARIYGYDKFPDEGRFTGQFPTNRPDPLQPLKRVINGLCGLGFRQCYNNSLQSQATASLSGLTPVRTINPLGEQMSVLRTCLFPGLLQNAVFNRNNGQKDLMLFEVGQVHRQAKPGFKNIIESGLIAGITSGSFIPVNVHQPQAVEHSCFVLKGMMESLIHSLANRKPRFAPTESLLFNPGFDILVNGTLVGKLGQFRQDYLEKINPDSEPIFGFDLYQDVVLGILDEPRTYRAIPSFPQIRRDLNFVCPETLPAQAISDAIEARKFPNLRTIVPANVFRHASLGEGKKSVVFTYTFQSDRRTLEDSEVNSVINEIISVVTLNFDCKLRSQ